MYQWVEDKHTKKSGGKRRTTYTYDMEWESGRQNHESFKHPEGHENPVYASAAPEVLSADDLVS